MDVKKELNDRAPTLKIGRQSKLLMVWQNKW